MRKVLGIDRRCHTHHMPHAYTHHTYHINTYHIHITQTHTHTDTNTPHTYNTTPHPHEYIRTHEYIHIYSHRYNHIHVYIYTHFLIQLHLLSGRQVYWLWGPTASCEPLPFPCHIIHFPPPVPMLLVFSGEWGVSALSLMTPSFSVKCSVSKVPLLT